MNKIEHIGLAVTDLKSANRLFSSLFDQAPYKEESVESEDVQTSFFQVGETKIELLEGGTDSAISKYIEKRGTGMHHIAFDVEDIHAEMKRLEAAGFELINAEPKEGADNKLVCFIHPRSAGGVLVELCQEKKS